MATVLFATTRIPFPPWEGHQIRTYNLLKSVSGVHDVHLISFVRKDEDRAHAEHLRGICASVELVEIPAEQNPQQFVSTLLKGMLFEKAYVVRKYFSPRMVEKIQQHISQLSPDLIHLDMLPLAQYLPFCGEIPVILNEHNVESLLARRRSGNGHTVFSRSFFSSQAKKLCRFEAWACRSVDQVLACSREDAVALREMGGGRSVEVIANGVDIGYFRPRQVPDYDRYNMVFVGGMGWFPNRDGMEFFLHKVMPLVCRQVPQATCTIVGKADGLHIPTRLVSRIRLTGFVEDLRPWVQRAGVYIIPLQVGSGTRLKLLEAMAMAKPVVSTAIGCEGVEVEHNKHLLIADKPEEMANAIVQLMRDPGLAAQLGQQAFRRAVERYDWKVLGDRLLGVYQSVLQRKSGPRSESGSDVRARYGKRGSSSFHDFEVHDEDCATKN